MCKSAQCELPVPHTEHCSLGLNTAAVLNAFAALPDDSQLLDGLAGETANTDAAPESDANMVSDAAADAEPEGEAEGETEPERPSIPAEVPPQVELARLADKPPVLAPADAIGTKGVVLEGTSNICAAPVHINLQHYKLLASLWQLAWYCLLPCCSCLTS